MQTRTRILDLARRFNEDVRISAVGNDGDTYLSLMNCGAFQRTKSAAYFNWFYREGSDSVLMVAREPLGRPLAQIGARLCALTGPVVGALVVDMVTVPERRGTGIFALVEQQVEDWARSQGAHCLFCFPNATGSRALNATGGWSLAAEIPTLECVNPLVVERGKPLMGPVLALVRSPSEVDWRFRRHPDNVYREWSAEGNVMWTKAFKDLDSGGTFTDLVSVGGGQATNPKLLGHVIEQVSAQGVTRFTAWALPGSPDERLLRNSGFSEGSQRRSLCVRWLSPEAQSRHGDTPWAVSQSDTEVF